MTYHSHTPTTEYVRGLYSAAIYEFNLSGPSPDPDAEFDLWHAAELAAAEQRGEIRMLRELAFDLSQGEFPGGYQAGIYAALLEISARLIDRLDRADRITLPKGPNT